MTETKYLGVPVVINPPNLKLDEKRQFLLNSIMLYANLSNRQLRVVFFNGEDREVGVAFFFQREGEE